MYQDTIAAIATPQGLSSVGIIRISGSEAIDVIDKVFTKPLKNVASHTINYGHIVDSDNNIIDEVLVMVMKAPKTYTREDVVEINCHGGSVVLNKVLLEVVKNGARIAENGEFTKRAFLNGRIDLAQVEAVMDIIEARTELALNQAIGQLDGKLSAYINNFQQTLLGIIARIEVSIDYPEYESELDNEVKEDIVILNDKLKQLLSSADTGKMIKEGVKTAIVGVPNAGKSSLLNALLEEDKAIVTDIAGTTRDVVEASINIGGAQFVLWDTAGICETTDTVEQIGIKKAKECIEVADLILLVLDGSRELYDIETELIDSLLNKNNVIYVTNKSDLNIKVVLENSIGVSAKNKIGLDELKQIMVEKSIGFQVLDGGISNQRQKESLAKAINSLDKVLVSIYNNMPEDCWAIDLHDAYGYLGMIIGESLKEEILDGLFSRFCLGK